MPTSDGLGHGTIELLLEFATLARRPDIRRFGRRWDICVKVDDQLHVFQEGPSHVIPVGAGSHSVQVWFRGAGLAFLARSLRFGERSVQMEVLPGTTVRLRYEGSTFWHMGGAAELRRLG